VFNFAKTALSLPAHDDDDRTFIGSIVTATITFPIAICLGLDELNSVVATGEWAHHNITYWVGSIALLAIGTTIYQVYAL
jgi:hypothetical protein